MNPERPTPKDSDNLVVLTSTTTEFEAETIAAALRNNDVPAFVFCDAARVMPVPSLSHLPYQVHVREGDLSLAGNVLRSVRAESIDIDWEDVDVGPPLEGAETNAPVSSAKSPLRHGVWLALLAVPCYFLPPPVDAIGIVLFLFLGITLLILGTLTGDGV